MNSKLIALICDRGSLTGRFKQIMGENPNLTKLTQGMKFVSPDERLMLNIPNRQKALVREIKMGKRNKNWLFARTVVPLSTLRGKAKRISMLNDTPIGKILFGRNGAKRKSMQVFYSSYLPFCMTSIDCEYFHPLWQRRSIFEFPSGPLMVNEVFLPDCPIYDK